MESLKESDKKIENGPKIRIVGGASPKGKEETAKRASVFFTEGHLSNLSKEQRDKIKKLEFKKEDNESFLVGYADRKVSELMEKCGVNSYVVPPENFHILSPEFYVVISKGIKNSAASTYQEYQIVIFDAEMVRDDNLFFGLTAFHETEHLKSHLALEVEEKEYEDDKGEIEVDTNVSVSRRGIAVGSAQKRIKDFQEYHEHFRGLNEAVVSYFEKDFFREMLYLPIFEKEKKWLESIGAADLKSKIAKSKKIDAEDIYWVDEEGKGCHVFSYPHHRKVFNVLINEIQKNFPDKFPDEHDNAGKLIVLGSDKVALEFLKSMFNGDLKVIANLVEETFGDLSFRVLGMMSDDKNSAINVLEYLRAALRNKNSKERGKYNKNKDENE